MADNFISYNRFTSLPNNIAEHGSTVEEIVALRGKPDRNPVLSPMAAPRVSERRLFLRPEGSDALRMGEPNEPMIDPYEGALSSIVLTRSVTQKLDGQIIHEMEVLLDNSGMLDVDLRHLMRDSLRRLVDMKKRLKETNRMAENIMVQAIAASRG